MAVGGRINVRVNQEGIRALGADPDGPVAQIMGHAGEIVTQGAKVRAPVSPHGSNGRPSGYLRSQIGWEPFLDDRGLVGVHVSSPAESPEGAPYGLFQEVGTRKMPAQPHLVPALDDLNGAKL